MVSQVSPAGQEQGSEEATTWAKTVLNGIEESRASSICRIETILNVKEESRASSICRIGEPEDCCSGSVANEVEVDNSESGIWMEVKNARVFFSFGDFFYALVLGLGPTVCSLLKILIISRNVPYNKNILGYGYAP